VDQWLINEFLKPKNFSDREAEPLDKYIDFNRDLTLENNFQS